MRRRPKRVGASVQARLLRLAHEGGEDFQLLLTRYVNERFLYRLSKSRHGRHFVIKGAALFAVWTGKPHRATRDLDLLGFGDPSEEHIRETIREVLALDVEDDGVRFDADSLDVGPIREKQEYGGIRVAVTARLATAAVRMQVDVGFGDAITPDAQEVAFPTLLDFPAPRLRTYPPETVVAEKVQAMVQLGLANSRMKDFYDLVIVSRMFEFDGDLLVRAIQATFERRKTPLPTTVPAALTAAFADDPAKALQWAAFVRKSGGSDLGDLPAAVAEIARFLEKPLAGAAGAPPPSRWPAGGPWA